MTTMEAPLVTPTGRLVLGPDATRDEWLAARKQGIGSSDAAAILGIDPWNSALSLWLEKTGRVEVDKPNEAMLWGMALEGPIADEFARREGLRILPTPGVLAHKDTDWLRANPDRMLAGPDDERAYSFVEVKNVSAWKHDEWDAEAGVMPPNYLIQVLHQLAVTGYDEASVACLIGGQRLEHLTVQRDQALIDQILEKEAEFWDLVQSDTQPAYDGSRQSVDAIRAYRATPGRVFDLDDEHLAIIEAIRARKAVTAALRKQLKEADEAEKAEIARLQLLMGEAEIAVYADEPLATWKEAPRKGYVVEPSITRTFRLPKQSD